MRVERLESLDKDDHLFGNKAINLSWLIQNNFLVPDGICVLVCRKEMPCDLYSLSSLHEFVDSSQGKYIVRSSSIFEDGSTVSNAGFYDSTKGLKSVDNIVEASMNIIENAFYKNKEMKQFTVIVQKYIRGLYSGIFFTTHPVKNDLSSGWLSVTKGENDLVTSGYNVGCEYSIQDGSLKKVRGTEMLPEVVESTLLYNYHRIKKLYPAPCDVEWVMTEDRKFYFLQVRNITGLNDFRNNIKRVGASEEIGDNKENINLRYYSRITDVLISTAWHLEVLTNSTQMNIHELVSEIHSEEELFSVVLINPKTYNSKVFRKFSNRDSIERVVLDIITKVEGDQPKIELVVKEIIKTRITGMLTRTSDGNFHIEIARGQFIPKGVSEVSHYILNSDCEVIFKNEVKQSIYYELTTGLPREYVYNKVFAVDINTLSTIVTHISPLFSYIEGVVEFGLTINDKVVALDYTEEDIVFSRDPSDGIISKGVIDGVLLKADELMKITSSFDYHMKDEKDFKHQIEKRVVVWSKYPSLNLLSLIEEYGIGNIGFVFSELSLLCHLSIRLRELKVPAVWSEVDYENYIHKKVRVNADTSNISRNDRVKVYNI